VVKNNNSEVLKKMLYLGRQLCNEGRYEASMKRRIAMAEVLVTFHRSWEEVFRRRE
jgi:hypothetical protein